MALQFTMNNGDLVGEGCCRTVAYLKSRVRIYCNRLMNDDRAKEAIDSLLNQYGSDWWIGRNGMTVGAICREVYKYGVIAHHNTVRRGKV